MVHVHVPSRPLAWYVQMLWYEDGYQERRHTERVLPAGGFMLVIDLANGPGAVIGMRSRYLEIDPAAVRAVIGVLFRPGGARPFFDATADEFFGSVVSLDLRWPSIDGLRNQLDEATTVAERFRLVEGELQRRLQPRRQVHPAVTYGLREFQRLPHVRGVLDVTRDAGLSRRRFAQLFREHVGMTPKAFCRLQRFRFVASQLCSGHAVNWADVALAGGYSDQAHLSHEFRDFSGRSPNAFLSAERPSCRTRAD